MLVRSVAGLLGAAALAAVATGPARAAAPPEAPLALDVLALVTVANEFPGDFDRAAFATGLDLDGDGCATRAEVLQRDSLVPVEIFGTCEVVAGSWRSPYDGVVLEDPSLVEIDHLVPLDEAWDSGAWAWDDHRRAAFANDLDDPRTLVAVSAASNQAKGNADPTNWIPTDPDAVCGYLADWIAVKARWGLTMDQSEAGRIRNLLDDGCPGQTVEPWPEVEPVASLPPTTAPASPATTLAAVVPLLGQDSAGGPCDPAYPDACIPPAPPDLDCGDVAARRFTVLPPDPHNFDGDGDGVGCEGS